LLNLLIAPGPSKARRAPVLELNAHALQVDPLDDVDGPRRDGDVLPRPRPWRGAPQGAAGEDRLLPPGERSDRPRPGPLVLPIYGEVARRAGGAEPNGQADPSSPVLPCPPHSWGGGLKGRRGRSPLSSPFMERWPEGPEGQNR